MGVAGVAGIVSAVLAAGSAVYSADQQRKASNASLRAQAAREAKADASKTQETKLPGAKVGLDPAKIGAALGAGGTGASNDSGTLSGALLTGGSGGIAGTQASAQNVGSTTLLGG